MDRWEGIIRPYSQEEVNSLKDRFGIDHTIARKSSEKLWKLLNSGEPVRALGCLTGNQAIQSVQAGLKSIYISGWQVAADANSSANMFPDMGLYPSNSVPQLVKSINNALQKRDQIDNSNGLNDIDWLCPMVCDLEAGFGGTLNVFELTKQLIEAGGAALHLEDQKSEVRRCGHLGAKTIVPTSDFIKKLIAARLAADVMEVPTIIIARTDAESAVYISSDHDVYDHDFILNGSRQSDGSYKLCRTGLERCVSRGLAYAPYCDLIWMETSKPDLGQAKEFAQIIHEKYPGKLLAYNKSPSFNWKANLTEKEIIHFHEKLYEYGFTYQFVTLAGFHSLNYSMFNLALSYNAQDMYGYSRLQQDEVLMETAGYTATKHQSFVGAGYYDKVNQIISGAAEETALKGSTENEQF